MNEHLSSLDAMLVGGVSMEAVVAVIVHVKVRRVSSLRNRALSLGIAWMAAAYAVAYQILLWTNVDPGDYQNVLRGMGLVAWPLVWIAPYAIRIRSKMGDQLVREVERKLRVQ